MAYNPLLEPNSILRGADISEMQASGASFEEPAVNYAKYGITGALTSGAVGIYNSFASLGNVIGADIRLVSEEDQIKKTFGRGAAEFYGRHKAGVDIAGLLISSMGVGIGAVSALRGLQAAGRITLGIEAATGLKNAQNGIILGSRSLQVAKEAAVANPVSFSLNNRATWNAIGNGFKQQMAEAFVFDGAVVLTTNQNAIVADSSKTYGENLWSYAEHTAPFTLAFGALGGGIQALQIRGQLKNYIRENTMRNSHFITIMGGMPEFGNAGDRLTYGLKLANDLEHDAAYAIAAGDKFAEVRKSLATDSVNTYITKAFGEINNAGKEGLELLNQQLAANKAGTRSLSDIAEAVSGLSGLRYVTNKDLVESNLFFMKTVAPTVVAAGKDLAHSMELGAAFLKQGAPKEQHQLIDDFFADMETQINPIAFGTQRGNQEYMQRIVEKLRTGKFYWGHDVPGLPAADTSQKAIYGVAQTSQEAMNNGGYYIYNLKSSLEAMEKAMVQAGVMAEVGKFSKMSKQDFADMVMLHEITHFKTNGAAAVQAVDDAMRTGNKLAKELEVFSRERYPAYWSDFDDNIAAYVAAGKTRKEAREEAWLNHRDEYGLRPVELISQASEFVLHPKFAETARRLAPNVSKFFNEHGAINAPFNPRKTYKNVRTGEETSTMIPLPQDLGKVSLIGDSVRVAGTRIGFKYDRNFFNPERIKDFHDYEYSQTLSMAQLPYMKAAAMFAAMAGKKFSELLPTSGKILTVHKHDLPLLEKLATELNTSANVDTLLNDGIKIMMDIGENGKVQLVEASQAMLHQAAVEGKQKMRHALTMEYNQNEHMMANALNMEVKHAMGVAGSGEEGYLLMGVRNYDRPENIVASYTKISPKQVDVSVKSEAALAQRDQIIKELGARAAAEIFGKNMLLLPSRELVSAALAHIDEVATRAGGLNATRSSLGKLGLREIAQSMGRTMKLIKGERSQNIEEIHRKWYGVFNDSASPDSYRLRAELALATNKLYEGWFNSFTLIRGAEDPVHMLVSLEHMKQYSGQAEELLNAVAKGDGMAQAELQAIVGRNPGISLDPESLALALINERGIGTAGMKLSKEVFEYFEQAIKPFQKEAARNHSLIAKGRGAVSTHRTDVLYPPPRSLTRSPHVAFVIPKSGMVDADEARYMLYGRTAKELEVKMQAAKEMYGDSYHIRTADQVGEHKGITGEFNKDDVFDEWFFDPSLTRKGRAAEAIPGLDIEASEVLDRFRNYQHRTSESQVMSAAELYYNDVTHALKTADREFGRAAAASVTGRKTQDTIFADTLNMMLDKSGKHGVTLEKYKQINGIVGEKGGAIIDAVVNAIGKPASKGFTQAHLDDMNKKLADQGFNPPFTDVVRAIAASPDTSNSRSFETLVRTMNNLAGTFQLRLDMANSILQVISTPILMLPAVREAIANSREVRKILSVHNPALGVAEPSPMRLMFKAVQRFWKPEGKQMMEEARKRGILTDYLKEYVEAQDFSSLTGRHSMQALNDAVDKLGAFGGKWSAHRFAEDFSRFLVISSLHDVGVMRGMKNDELWSVIGNGVDTVHGIYRSHQRVQAFNGVIGQAVGMYQTYMFNWMQNAMHWVEGGNTKAAMQLAALQTTVFGIRSLPGFETFNQQIAKTNSGQMDAYTSTGADDPDSWASWVMYGLGSHAFVYPIDIASRGDMVLRNKLVLPTQIQDIPSVSILSRSLVNMYNTASMLANNDTSVGNALLFGLAHNGLSRPLQGVGTALMGQVTTGQGTPLFVNSNYHDYDMANGFNVGALMSRLIGTRPLEEAIRMDNYYRQTAYQANVRPAVEEIGKEMKLAVANGRDVSAEDWESFAARYERTGAKLENFNAFTGRVLSASSESAVTTFKYQMDTDSPLSRLRDRMMIEREPASIADYQQ